MANLDSVLTTLNTNIETNAAIHSSQFDSVDCNGAFIGGTTNSTHRGINIFPAWKDRRLTLGTEI